MEAYLCKYKLQDPVSVSCLVYASERRPDERKLLKLTPHGIELHSPPSSEPDVLPWSSILGASESTSSIRRRFLTTYEGTEYGEENEFIVFGCTPKRSVKNARGLTSLALAVLPSILTGSNKPEEGVERALVQWVFRCEDGKGDAVSLRMVKAIRFFADPRIQVEGNTMEKLLDPYGFVLPRKFMVVINPAGGKGDAQKTYDQQVAPVLEQANVEVETVVTRHAADATEIMENLCLNQYDCIVAVGGDGLLSEMLQGLMNRKDWQKAVLQPLGIIPAGSGNGLSASLLSRAGERLEVLNAAYSLAKGRVQDLDLFSATNSSDKVMYGFLSLEWAFIADVDIKSERYRFFGGMRFFIATALQIFGFGQIKFPGRLRYRVAETDAPLPEKYHDTYSPGSMTAQPISAFPDKEQRDEEAEKWLEIQGPFYMFWGMNVSHAAADAHIAPSADISDGHFHLMLVSGERYSRLAMARLMMGIEDGSHLGVDRVQLIRTRAFTIRASDAEDLICIDGELFPGPEVNIEVYRALGRVLCLPGNK
ncbi:hypothetical protein PsorP6_011129 [Peronosclerospora sorghi]|uniref:Uncharacterized protein n=1 Tax=Peronosclerospora sorghi TaxID=230839 RepID=A0ACC0VWH1_9STRA|nr:hypothetical protein PsorP6_011129 [Peronosclerospora sorghi]